MWGESSKECESNCQCSGLITDSFKINSGNNATKRRREEALNQNYKHKIHPLSLDFTVPISPLDQSPVITPKRRVLGELQNSPRLASINSINTPLSAIKTPLSSINSSLNSPKLNAPFVKRASNKISKIFEERTKFKMSFDKENRMEEFMSLNMSEDTRDSAYDDGMSPVGLQRSRTVKDWTVAKMTSLESSERNFSSVSTKSKAMSCDKEIFAPDADLADMDSDFETLHDLDAELECDNFDQCSKYEIISTDSPDIISRGRTSSSRKVNDKNFVFGAPIGESEQSTSFNTKPNINATRMLNFEFTSPNEVRKTTATSLSVKKSLKFSNETPTKLKLYPSESTTSMESGFISEIEDTLLDIDDTSNSPKMANFNELISGEIKTNITECNFIKRPILQRSLSYNPEATKARVSLFSKSPKKSKRLEPVSEGLESLSKKRKANSDLFANRPILQRSCSLNAASIMSALARSASDPDLIGDFSQPFALPLTAGNHSDLKSISCDTLATLLRGEYQTISDYQVIDCRYPYEYQGGHIIGAQNLYTAEQILELVNRPLQTREEGSKRSVLVFHCEFSLERGPKLSRFLRSSDRAKNKENYPSLHYPEVYLLHEGYRAFYNKHPDLCSPAGYTAMLDPNHKAELSHFRSKGPSKSFML